MRGYKISDVAEMLNVHPNTLRNWEKRGLIKPARAWNGYRVYSVELTKKLDELLNGRTKAKV